MDMSEHDLHRSALLTVCSEERMVTEEELVKHQPERINVCGRGWSLPLTDLGRHISWRAEDMPVQGPAPLLFDLVEDLRDAKV